MLDNEKSCSIHESRLYTQQYQLYGWAEAVMDSFGLKRWTNGLNDRPINRLTYGDVQVTKKNSNNLQEKYIKSAKNTSWNLADVGNLLTLINEKYSFSIIISIFIVINSVKQVTNTSHPPNILLRCLQVARLDVADNDNNGKLSIQA